MHEALWYEIKEEQGFVLCKLCPHRCCLKPGEEGICRVRHNEAGKLYTRNYGRCSPVALDPIEKKPLYHFFPGKTILSVGTGGCNFKCRFCQNWQLAQWEPPLDLVSSGDLVKTAVNEKDQECIGIAYTYSEPLVWYEFVLETAQAARRAGFKNVLVTNGFINEEPLKELVPLVDALNIDIKGFSLDFYRNLIKGDYRPVLRTAEIAHRSGCHVEITTLLIGGLNDSEQEIHDLVNWLVKTLGPEVPLHFSRYFPNYQLDLPPTPLTSLQRAKTIAEEQLHYVYLGNAPELNGSDTFCPECGQQIINRSRYRIDITGLDGRSCSKCHADLNFVLGEE